MTHPEEVTRLAALLPDIIDPWFDETGIGYWAHAEDEDWPLLAARLLAAGVQPEPQAGDHPHDGYAYDGCKCICCLNVRALQVPRAALQPITEAATEGEPTLTVEHATNAHYAQSVSCDDKDCPLNWRRLVDKARAATEPAP